jgi:hypothetical protein
MRRKFFPDLTAGHMDLAWKLNKTLAEKFLKSERLHANETQ